MTPAEVFDRHRLNECHAGADVCVECHAEFPCDAWLLAVSFELYMEVSAQLTADLVKQRDSLLPHPQE